MIKVETATVYRAAGRRYLTLEAACHASLMDLLRKMGRASGEDPYVNWDKDRVRIERIAKKMVRRVRRRMNRRSRDD